MTAKAAEYNGWCIVIGQDFRQKFVVKDPSLPKVDNPDYDSDYPEDPITNPKQIFQPKDLTGYSAKMTIRQQNNLTSDELITLEVGSGITLGSPTPTDGTVELFIDSTVTDDAEFTGNVGDNYYDFWLIPADPEDNQRLLFGIIEVVEPVTDVTP